MGGYWAIGATIGYVYVPGGVAADGVPAPPREVPPRDGTPSRLWGDGVDQWRTLISSYFPAHAVEQAMRVLYGTANCPNGESGGDPAAYNAGNYGGFQVAYPTHRDKLIRVAGVDDPSLLFDPAVNTGVAYLVWLESGGGTFLPWACR